MPLGAAAPARDFFAPRSSALVPTLQRGNAYGITFASFECIRKELFASFPCSCVGMHFSLPLPSVGINTENVHEKYIQIKKWEKADIKSQNQSHHIS